MLQIAVRLLVSAACTLVGQVLDSGRVSAICGAPSNASEGPMRREFTPTGIYLGSRSGNGVAWHWSLELMAFSRGSERLCAEEPELVRGAGRVEYRREGSIEWYVERANGIEHGFRLEEPPPFGGEGALRLELEVGGSLCGTAVEGGDGVRFSTHEGEGALLYRGLVVQDSEGRRLPARLSIDGAQLTIAIDDAGACWPIDVDPVIYTEDAVILPPDATQAGAFGIAAAGEGDTWVVGDIFAYGSGAAFVYSRSERGWVREARLIPSDGADSDYFGLSIALSGENLVVGSPEDDDGGIGSGSAYVFRRSGTHWSESQKLTASDGWITDSFGSSVSIEGDTLVVGAPEDDDMGQSSGSAYVFCYDGTSWKQVAKLVAPDGAEGDGFGKSVLLEGPYLYCAGTYARAGNLEVGAVYVFEGACGSWAFRAKLVPNDPAQYAKFGSSLSARGGRLVIGSPGATGASWNSGAVYVYEGAGSSWSFEAKLFPPDGTDDDYFGYRLAQEQQFVIANSFSGGLWPDAGSCSVYQRTSNGWDEIARLAASDGTDYDNLGSSIVMLEGTVIAGAKKQGPHSHGAAYIYNLPYHIEGYCFGDGSGAPCPCFNASPPGSSAGCLHSGGVAGRLTGSGSTSLGAGDLVLTASQLLPGQPALLFAGEARVSGGAGAPFGDGLRCAGSHVVRLAIQTPDAAGDTSFGPGLALPAGWEPGDLRHFQVWYRDPASLCGSGFNATNAVSVRWAR